MNMDHHKFRIWPIEHPHKYERGHSGCCTSTSGLSGGTTCGYEEKQHPRWPCSATCTHDDAWVPGHPERVRERSEAFQEMHPNGSCTCAGEGACAWCDRESKETYYDRGVEDMRAACLRDVVALLESTGLRDHGSDSIIQRVKAAIEGATP